MFLLYSLLDQVLKLAAKITKGKMIKTEQLSKVMEATKTGMAIESGITDRVKNVMRRSSDPGEESSSPETDFSSRSNQSNETDFSSRSNKSNETGIPQVDNKSGDDVLEISQKNNNKNDKI